MILLRLKEWRTKVGCRWGIDELGVLMWEMLMGKLRTMVRFE